MSNSQAVKHSRRVVPWHLRHQMDGTSEIGMTLRNNTILQNYIQKLYAIQKILDIVGK